MEKEGIDKVEDEKKTNEEKKIDEEKKNISNEISEEINLNI